MGLRRDGRNVSAYLGVSAPTPPQFEKHPRAPTANDYRNFNVSTIWLDTSKLKQTPSVPPTSDDIYILVSKSDNVAYWINFGSGTAAVNSVIGGASINITGMPADPIVNVNAGTVNTVTLYGALGVLSEVSSVGTNGQILTANTGLPPTWQAATGIVDTITGGTNINIGGTATDPIVNLDAAISLATSVTSPLYTVASGDLVLNMADDAGTDSVSFTNDSDAEVASIDSLGAATFTNLTVDNVNVNGNTIISSDVDGDITLTPNGTGKVNITYATPNTVAVYGTSGALTEVVGVGATGEVLSGNTGAAPTWQTNSASSGGGLVASGPHQMGLSEIAGFISLFRSKVPIGSTVSTTEVNAQVGVAAGTFSKLIVNVLSSTLSIDTDWVLRVNGSDTALTITIPSGSTGGVIYSDLSNTVNVSDEDLVCLRFTPSPGGGANLIFSVVYAAS